GARYATDADLCRALGGTTAATMLAGRDIVADVAAKHRLSIETGACAVDLESGAVARVATGHHLPFAVLRAVCDPAGRGLPRAAIVAIDARGAIAAWRILAALAARPWEVAGLIALAFDAARARHALGAAAASFARRLGGG
ncbi:MAG: nucleoside phosphorylase, partial [Rhodospirillales bacterium]|nr:nucleoside phosphorylase [Rhodospirillales bacterium]